MSCPGDVASKAYVDGEIAKLKALLSKQNDYAKKSDLKGLATVGMLAGMVKMGDLSSYAKNSFVNQVNQKASAAWNYGSSAKDMAQTAENYAKNAAKSSYDALIKANEAKALAKNALDKAVDSLGKSVAANTKAIAANTAALAAQALATKVATAIVALVALVNTWSAAFATKRELSRVWTEFDNQEAARQRDFNLLNNILMRIKSQLAAISGKADIAISKANNAIGRATMAINNANAAMNEASKAMTRAGVALTKANLAINKAGNALASAISASLKADNAYNLALATKSELISKINQLTSQITNIKNEVTNFVTTVKSNLAELKTYIDSLKVKINQLENIVKSFSFESFKQSILSKLRGIESDVTTLDSKKTNKDTTAILGSKVTTNTNKINDLESEISKFEKLQVNTKIREIEKMNTTQYKDLSSKLDKITTNTSTPKPSPEINQKLEQLQKNDENILQKVGKLALPIVAIKLGIDGILKGVNAIKNRQSPCEARIIPPIVNAQTVASQGVIMGGVGTNLAQTIALRTSWTTWLNGSWTTFTTKFSQMFSNLHNPLRAANEIIQTGLMYHNAIMLSRDIGYTLGFILDNIQNALGMQWTTELGEQVPISQAIGKSLKDRMIEMLGGQEKWRQLSFEWFKWSTIYNAAANTVFTVTGMIQTVQSTIDLVGSFTGKIGNALKSASVVSGNAYNWLPDNIHTNTEGRFAKFFRAIDNVNDVSSTIANVTSDAVSVKDQFTYLKTIDDETKQAITDRENEILNADNESRLESEAPVSLETANLDNYLE